MKTRQILIAFSLAGIFSGVILSCNPGRVSTRSLPSYDTVIAVSPHEDCPPWEQPSKRVEDIDFWTFRGATFVVFYYPCNGVTRLVKYQVRWRPCGPIYIHEFRDTCH